MQLGKFFAVGAVSLMQSFAAGLDFEVPFWIDGQVKTRAFNTETGPADGKRLLTGVRLVPSGAENVYVGIDRGNVWRVNANGERFSESSAKPELGDWAMGIAYDSQEKAVFLVTLGGEGYLYKRTAGGEWSEVSSMNNLDFESLVYRPTDDALYGIEVYGGSPNQPARLYKYSTSGEELSEKALPAFPVNLRPGEHTAELIAVGDKIVALIERTPDGYMAAGDHSRIYVIDPATGAAELTYDNEPGHAPTVEFVSPATGSTVTVNTAVALTIRASDPDNDLRFMVLREEPAELKMWSLDPSPSGTYTATHSYTPRTLGTHTLEVSVNDLSGRTAKATLTLVATNPPPPNPTNDVRFVGWYFADDHVIGVDYTEEGPVDGGTLYRGLHVAQAGYRYLGRDGHTIFRWDNEDDEYTTTEPGGDFSWPRGTAYDSKRNRFLVVTLVGEGALYAVDPVTLAWTTIASMQNVDVDSIVYHHADDHLYMVENHGYNVRILRYNSTGQQVGSFSIRDVPLEIGSYYQSRLISAGSKIALLIEPTVGWPQSGSRESRIYIIDPAAQTAEMTYRKVWDSWPPQPPEPPQPAPTIAITAPVNNSEHSQAKPITITARGNVAFDSVAIYADGAKIGDARQSALAIHPPQYGLIWSNAPVGAHTLIAIGQTARSAATSAPVNIRVIGITNVMTVERDLPDSYSPNTWVNVKLVARPSVGATGWAVEEQPPLGWVFGQASHEGTYDAASKKIKWGPFTDAQQRTLLYTIRPDTNSTGVKTFTGVFSVNGVSKLITGDRTISSNQRYHPADASAQDSRLTIDEVTAYAAAWKAGTQWPRPPATIPVSYVTRAAQIWKSGEVYEFAPSMLAPMCWVPTGQTDRPIPVAGAAAYTSVSEATRSVSPDGSNTKTVSVTVRPAAGVKSYAVEERPPTGWTIASAEGAGVVNGSLRYGPFFDAQLRTFTYQVVPASVSTGAFVGAASFDGSTTTITGAGAATGPTCLAEHRNGRVYLSVNSTAGETLVLESSTAVDSAAWQLEATIEGGQGAVELPAIEPSASLKFFRLRPVAQ